MKIITISREFGSGGRELGKRLADVLGFDYYDSEIISAVAKGCGLSENYVEKTLGEHGWQKFPMTYRCTLSAAGGINNSKVELLLQQKKVLEGIAALGRDCVIVGRNADVILRQYEPFNLFVCASAEAKVKRCQERAPEGEELTEKELRRKMKQIDKLRSQTRQILTDAPWGERGAYHLTVNTTGWEMKELAGVVAELALRWFGRTR